MPPKHCRICYKSDNDDLISVRLKQNSVSIEEMILSITGITVTADRRLPQNICLECLDRLKAAYELRQQCIQTNDWLCEKLSVPKDNIEHEIIKETKDVPLSTELSKQGGEEEMTERSIKHYDEEMGHKSRPGQNQLDVGGDGYNFVKDNTDVNQEIEMIECLDNVEELEVRGPSLQKLEIEIDTGENESNAEHEYMLPTIIDEQHELTIEMNLSDESTIDLEVEPSAEEQYDDEWEQHGEDPIISQPRTNKSRKMLCRISRNDLIIRATEPGYLIVELRQYRCCCCAGLFTTEEELQVHLKEKGEQNKVSNPDPNVRYVCEYCGKHFKLWLVYMCHKRLREQRQFYMCRLCNVLLDSATRMISHMLVSEQHANYFNLPRECIADRYTTIMLSGERCCCCKKYFDENEALMEHVRRSHPSTTDAMVENMPYGCDVCGRRFRSTDRLEHHLQYTVDVRQHYCKLCDFQTYNPRRMELHMYSGIHRDTGMPAAIELKPLENKPLKSNPVRCCCFFGCSQNIFTDEPALQLHIQEKHREALELNKARAEQISKVLRSEMCFKCDNCYLVFKDTISLNAHQTPRRIRQEYVCSVCGVSKRSRSDLVIHERAHTGEKPFPCDQCNKTFASKKTLASHRSCHTPGLHTCEVCEARFNRKENLNRHTMLKHGKATIPCDVCGKMFKTTTTLNIHMVSHTGEKRFHCRMEPCDKRYATVADRRRHEMSVHTQERPHGCAYCKATFTRKRQLTIHERRHTGEKPFVCPDCGKDFIDGCPLRVHMRKGCKSKP
uniref:Uncharacterized protein n=1 Tax=Anopheles epiroticus TaxID=199890 RepID=A0A182P650_9DIPT